MKVYFAGVPGGGWFKRERESYHDYGIYDYGLIIGLLKIKQLCL